MPVLETATATVTVVIVKNKLKSSKTRFDAGNIQLNLVQPGGEHHQVLFDRLDFAACRFWCSPPLL
jgi:hypothetical protein